jgi:iron complex outermembrane receptor protein
MFLVEDLMNKRNLVGQAIRYALVAGAATAVAYLTPASAANGNRTPANLGKVEVTGTRIRRTSLETAQEVTHIDRQQIQASGFTTIGQILHRLVAASRQISASTASSGAVVSNVNLRNLGVRRTLVLVNGKRWVSSFNTVVDLNTIPTSIIDHIDVLQDGASAIYGSDAIGGVVNIIMNKNFHGIEANAYMGIYHGDGHWDGKRQDYNVTLGGGNDRGNVVVSLDYNKGNAIFRGNRDISREPVYGTGLAFGSTSTPAGRFQIVPAAGAECPMGVQLSSGRLCDFTVANPPRRTPRLNDFRQFTENDRYNRAAASYLLRPDTRTTAYLQGHYDLLNNVTFTTTVLYNRNQSEQQLLPDEIDIGAQGTSQGTGLHIGLGGNNPYNPFGYDLVPYARTSPEFNQWCSLYGSGANGGCTARTGILSRIGRLPLEARSRRSEFNTENFHAYTGFNGYLNLFNREIDWDTGFGYSSSKETDINNTLFDTVALQNALGDVNRCDILSGCVPVNLFGGASSAKNGSLTPAQLNYIAYEAHGIQKLQERDWTVDLSTDVYELPAGPLGIAIGYEYRDVYGSSQPDVLAVKGETTGGTTLPTSGNIRTDAEYAEINVPLFANLPGVKKLSIDIANRWSQFMTNGGTTQTSFGTHTTAASTGRLALRWQATNDLLLRTSWSEGFRTPRVTDLFASSSTTLAQVSDPCAPPPYGSYTGGSLPPFCPGVDSQTSSQIPATVGGNPQLRPEHSISRTAGIVYSPSWLEGFSANVDYYKIEIAPAIETVTYQNVLNGCYSFGRLCDEIIRSGDTISHIERHPTSGSDVLTEGFDIGLSYKFPSTSFGDFSARLNANFVKTYDETKPNSSTRTGFATSHLAGTGGFNFAGTAYPKRKANAYLDWDYGNWSAEYSLWFIGDYVEPCRPSAPCSNPENTLDGEGVPNQYPGHNHVASATFQNIEASYTFTNWNTTLALGVQNMTDKNPPVSEYTSGPNYYPRYRPPGRYFWGRLSFRF